MNGILIQSGTNLGDRFLNLKHVQYWIEREVGQIIHLSEIYESEVWGATDQPNYLNQVFEIESNLEPESLLDELQTIESRFGRWRKQKFGPRIMDLDILYYGKQQIDLPHLQIPHPQISFRRFTLELLHDFDPKFKEPISGISIEKMLSDCKDVGQVWKFRPL